MRWDDLGDEPCSIARALAIVGDRWTMIILRQAFLRTRRFEDFGAQLGLPRPVLASRLRKLVEHGLLERVRYQERPERFEYRLTAKGIDIYPVFAALMRWGDRWLAGKAGPPVTLVHRDCGHAIASSLTCSVCGTPVSARDVRAEAGPGLHRQRKRATRAPAPAPRRTPTSQRTGRASVRE